MNELIIKWSDKLGLEYVKNIIADFDFMEIEFYEDRNKKEVIDVFLMYDIYSDNPKRIKLLIRTSIKMNFENFTELSIDYYYKDI